MMTEQIGVRDLTLAGLAHRCAQETERFFQKVAYDARYCFELFRRAIEERNQRAWDLLYRQYRTLVVGWARRHPAFVDSGEEAQYFVNRAFEKMWSAMSPEKFTQFGNLKSVLRYLQMCVHSAVIDQTRSTEPPTTDTPPEETVGDEREPEETAEEQVLERLSRRRVWREVDARLKDEQERKVVYGSFVLGLKPSRLYEHYSGSFHDVNEIYRVKENVMARFRRDTELQEFLRENA